MLQYVAGFIDPEEALVAHGFLLANGIPSVIQNFDHLSSQPWLRVAMDGHRLLVPTEQLEEARVLLQEANERVFAVENEAAASTQRHRLRWDQYLWIPIALLFSVPFLPRPRGWFLTLLAFGFWAALMVYVDGIVHYYLYEWFGI